MKFEALAGRILSLQEHEDTKKPKSEKLVHNRFQIYEGKITIKTVSKSLFAQLVDKRFYFDDSIISIPIGHPLLDKLRQCEEGLHKK